MESFADAAVFSLSRGDEIGRKSRWYFGEFCARVSRENCGKSCSIRRRNKSRGKTWFPFLGEGYMILFAGVTKRGDDMNARRWLKGVSSEKLNPRIKRTWKRRNCGAAIFNLNICHDASLEFICLFCAFRLSLFFLLLIFILFPYSAI